MLIKSSPYRPPLGTFVNLISINSIDTNIDFPVFLEKSLKKTQSFFSLLSF